MYNFTCDLLKSLLQPSFHLQHDHSTLLLRCGDVEENPGPVTTRSTKTKPDPAPTGTLQCSFIQTEIKCLPPTSGQSKSCTLCVTPVKEQDQVAPLHCRSCHQQLHHSCWRSLHLQEGLASLRGHISWLCPTCCTSKRRSRPVQDKARPRGVFACQGCPRSFFTPVGLHRHLHHPSNTSCFLTPPTPPPPGFPGLYQALEQHMAAVKLKVIDKYK